MRRFTSICILAALVAFLPVFASASVQHKKVTLYQKAEVGHQQLTPGSYTVKFDNSSSNPKVQFVRDGKTVATVPAEIQHQPNVSQAQFEMNTANGHNRLDRIFVGSKEELVFGSAAKSASKTNS